MKKVVCIVLLLMGVLCLVACNSSKRNEEVVNTESIVNDASGNVEKSTDDTGATNETVMDSGEEAPVESAVAEEYSLPNLEEESENITEEETTEATYYEDYEDLPPLNTENLTGMA